MNANDMVGIGPEGLVGLPIPGPSLWTLVKTEASRPTGEVRLHPDLIAWIEDIEQPVEGGERLLPEFASQVILDGPHRVALSLEILGPQGSEGYRFLSPTRRRIGDRHVTPIVQKADDLARTLAGNAQFAPDIRDRRSCGIRAQAQHSTVGKSALVKPGVRHGPVQSALIADPGAAQGRSEADQTLASRHRVGARKRFGARDVHDQNVSRL